MAAAAAEPGVAAASRENAAPTGGRKRNREEIRGARSSGTATEAKDTTVAEASEEEGAGATSGAAGAVRAVGGRTGAAEVARDAKQSNTAGEKRRRKEAHRQREEEG